MSKMGGELYRRMLISCEKVPESEIEFAIKLQSLKERSYHALNKVVELWKENL